MLEIDGSFGEGGGQIIRTSLALSLVTGKPFRITHIRAGRKKPGLQPQHLTAVRAAAEVGNATVDGALVGSQELTFTPGKISPGRHNFKIGTAGSTTLVLQTVLPPLMIADATSQLTFEGGTHNQQAPPFDFIKQTLLPLINRMGARVDADLIRYGFYPPGGGSFQATIIPAPKLLNLELLHRGEIKEKRARAVVVKLPRNIAEREIAVISDKMPGWKSHELSIDVSDNAASPGNFVAIEFESDSLVETITAIGQRGVRAEEVAAQAVKEAHLYLSTDAPVGEHLADQLMVPLALSGGGSFTTGKPTLHTTTNAQVIKRFLQIHISIEQHTNEVWRVDFGS